MSKHLQKYFRYRGASMWPCFQEGDLLETAPINLDQIKVGDCLLFPDHEGQLIVHRLVRKRNGLRSRGDATAILDPFEIRPEQIHGKVTRCHRFDHTTVIRGGWSGLARAFFYRYAGRIDPERSSRGGRAGMAIQKISTTLFKSFWRQGKLRTLKQQQGTIIVWLLGKNVIGRQHSENSKWLVRWPWRVFVDITEIVE